MNFRNFATAVAVGAVTLSATFISGPVSAEVSFKGKTVTIVVPFQEGGGADVLTRVFQPFLHKHLPGNPKVIVYNRPGGAATKGSNYFDRKAEPDGLTAIAVSTSTMVSQVLGGGKAKFDVRKWRPVWIAPQDTVFYARPETGVKGKDLAQDVLALRKSGIVFGAKNATSAELRGLISFELLGIKNVKTVLGLSTGKQRKALMRGEVTVNYDSTGAFNQKVLKHAKKGEVVPFMTLGIPQPNGSVIRGNVFPNLPTVLDGYRALNMGKDPSGPIFEAWKNIATMGVSASKGMSLPKGTPDDIHEAWSVAIENILKDKDFIKKGRKIIGPYPIALREDAVKIYENAVSIKPESRAWMKDWIFKTFGVKISS